MPQIYLESYPEQQKEFPNHHNLEFLKDNRVLKSILFQDKWILTYEFIMLQAISCNSLFKEL